MYVKVLAFFLALLTLLLSMTPCCDGEDSNCMEEIAIECTEHTDTEEGNAHHDQPTSPFYACGSCLGFVNQQVPHLSLNYLSFVEKDFNSFYTESLSVSHLHPPNKPPIQI